MKSHFLQKTNLNQAIDGQLGLLAATTLELTEGQKVTLEKTYNLSEEEKKQDNGHLVEQKWKKEMEDKFLEFYENDLKTGFYIHRYDNDNEDVQFYNYNSDQGWFAVDKIGDSDKLTFFNNSGNIIQNQNAIDIKKSAYLVSQQNKYQYLKEFFEKYDYAVVIIYSAIKANNSKDDVVLIKIHDDLKEYSSCDFAISNLIPHFAYNNKKTESGFYRLTLFFSKFPYYKEENDNTQSTFDIFVEKLKGLESENKNLLLIPIIVKEEIKDIIRNDFGDDSDEILSYARHHRYECLYDSESDDPESEFSDDSISSDDSSDTDSDNKNEEGEQFVVKEE